MTQDESAADDLRSRGLTSMPVVVAGEDTWTGFRVDLLRSLVERVAAA